MDNCNIKIVEYNVVRRLPEFKMANAAKIVYVRKSDHADDEYDTFINEAIRQVFDNVTFRKVTNIELLRREVENYKKGLFHIQYELDTDKIDLYATEFISEEKKWPVYDIVFPLYVKSNGEGLDIVFKHEIAQMKYESKDIPSARDFIESLKKELINPLPIIYTLDWEEESYVMGAEEKMS